MSDVLDKILKGAIDLAPDLDEAEKTAPPKKWRNRYRWRHPSRPLPRPDGLIPPGGEFCTRGVYPSKELAEQAADRQMYSSEGYSWPPALRPFLQYLGPQKVED